MLTCCALTRVQVRAAFGYETPAISDVGEVSGGFPKLFFLDDQYDSEHRWRPLCIT